MRDKPCPLCAGPGECHCYALPQGEQEKAWMAGYAQAVKDYAVMRNGESFVGVRGRDLKVVLRELHEDRFVTTSLRIYLEDNPCPGKGQ
jgi:hypothetical protein